MTHDTCKCIVSIFGATFFVQIDGCNQSQVKLRQQGCVFNSEWSFITKGLISIWTIFAAQFQNESFSSMICLIKHISLTVC